MNAQRFATVRRLVTAVSLIILGQADLAFAQAQESIFQRAKTGVTSVASKTFGMPVSSASDPFSYSIVTIINILLTFVGVLFFAVLFYGGWLWMTARGNEDQLERAKRITRETIIGIIIIILARLLTELLIVSFGQAGA